MTELGHRARFGGALRANSPHLTGRPQGPAARRRASSADAPAIGSPALRARPFDLIEVVVSTADKSTEALRPQNPKLTFVAPDTDDFIVLDQSFMIEKRPARVGHRSPDHRPRPL